MKLLLLTIGSAAANMGDVLAYLFGPMTRPALASWALPKSARSCETISTRVFPFVEVLPQFPLVLVSNSTSFVARPEFPAIPDLLALRCPVVEATAEGVRCLAVDACEKIGNSVPSVSANPLAYALIGVLSACAVFGLKRRRQGVRAATAGASAATEGDWTAVASTPTATAEDEEDVYLWEILQFCGERRVFAARLAARLCDF